jgi:hypothetical protein
VARKALTALLYEALQQPEIQDALAEADVTDMQAGQAVLDNRTVLARVRMEQDEVYRSLLENGRLGDDRLLLRRGADRHETAASITASASLLNWADSSSWSSSYAEMLLRASSAANRH